MCDARPVADAGSGRPAATWHGWTPLPVARRVPMPCGEWIDLSHRLNESMPRASLFPLPRFSRLKSLPQDPLNATEMQMCVHLGTHVDSPRHFLADGPAFDQIPLDRLSGAGVIWRIAVKPDGVIDVADLERAQPRMQPGDIVALNTGWWKKAGTAAYDQHPCLSVAAARWLVEHRAKLLAVDLPTPDLAISRRPKGFDWPVHHVLLSHGVLVSEHLTNLDALSDRRVEFAFLALNIEGSDGAPARVVARAVTGE